MKLADAELQQTTGFPIVKGRLSIDPIAGMAAPFVSEHDRVLLEEGPNILAIWPVTHVARDDHGFCEATLGEFGVFVNGFGARDIGMMSSPDASRSFTRGGLLAGYLMKRKVDESSRPHVIPCTPLTSIHDYELKADYRPDGLHFAISGQFGAAYESDATEPGLDGKTFNVTATIPWEISVLKDYPGHGHRNFGHGKASLSNDALPDRIRDPRKLGDVLIEEGLGWPLVKGEILLAPESALPRREDRYATSGFLHINIGEHGSESISCWDAPSVRIRDSGFAWSSISIRRLDMTMFDWRKLERVFDRRDRLSMSFTGDALGQVGYVIDQNERVGPNMVRQDIASMSLRMALGQDGLEISADGELRGLEPAENPRHREHPNFENLRSNPIRSFALAATVPWALLAVRELRFADRVRCF